MGRAMPSMTRISQSFPPRPQDRLELAEHVLRRPRGVAVGREIEAIVDVIVDERVGFCEAFSIACSCWAISRQEWPSSNLSGTRRRWPSDRFMRLMF